MFSSMLEEPEGILTPENDLTMTQDFQPMISPNKLQKFKEGIITFGGKQDSEHEDGLEDKQTCNMFEEHTEDAETSVFITNTTEFIKDSPKFMFQENQKQLQKDLQD